MSLTAGEETSPETREFALKDAIKIAEQKLRKAMATGKREKILEAMIGELSVRLDLVECKLVK